MATLNECANVTEKREYDVIQNLEHLFGTNEHGGSELPLVSGAGTKTQEWNLKFWLHVSFLDP